MSSEPSSEPQRDPRFTNRQLDELYRLAASVVRESGNRAVEEGRAGVLPSPAGMGRMCEECGCVPAGCPGSCPKCGCEEWVGIAPYG